MRRLLICVFALMAPACNCNGSDAVAEIGTGTTAFESLADDQDLELVAGPQGGFHFIVNASMSGIRPGDPSMPGLLANPQTSFAVFSEAGDRLDGQFPPYRLGYRERDDGSGMLQLPSGRILALDDLVPPSSVYDQRVRITLKIREEGGPSATDEVFVIAREGPQRDPIDAGVDAAALDASVDASL